MLDHIFLEKISIAILGSAIINCFLENTETGLRLRTSSTATLPKLLKLRAVGICAAGRATSAAFLFLLIFSAERNARACFALGTLNESESIKTISPSLNLRESATNKAFRRMERLIFLE